MTRLESFSRYRSWLLGGVAVLGILICIAAWRSLERAEAERIASTFQRRAEAQVRVAEQRIRLYEEMVHGLANLYAGSQPVSREEFDRAAAYLLERHEGVQAIEWVEFVRDADRARFEAEARKEFPGFTIVEPVGGGRFAPAATRPDYTVIRQVTPLRDNEAALGYDNSRSPIAADLDRARRERRLVVTHQFRLAQAREEDEAGIIFAYPVFTHAGGAEAFRGFVQGVFRVETMLAQSHREPSDDALILQYRDLNAAPGQRELLYFNRAGYEERSIAATPLPERATPGFIETIALGGRRWEFRADMNPAWRARQETLTPPLVLFGSLITTGLVLLFINTLLRRTAEIESQVALRTAELERTKRELEEDIQRRREAEIALHASEARLEAIIDNSPAAIWVKDLAGRYILCNRVFETVSGHARADVIGRTDEQLYPPEAARIMRENDGRAIAAGAALQFDETVELNGRPRTSLVQKFPLRNADGAIYALCGISTDITDRLAAEQEKIEFERKLQQTQKLESLGVLAGGIAHDFNNILTAVLGNASLVRHLLPSGHAVLPQVEQIENAARRAADLCGQMLSYAGKRKLTPGRINLSALVRDTAALLEVSISKSARLHLDLVNELPEVEADATQLRQIVMNLVINAADSLGDATGDIHVRTFVTEATSEFLRGAVQNPELPAGRYVALEVSDNGSGVPPEILARIFEPFFTTKFAGRGLGLSAVLGIVRSHRGALFVDSAPKRGTTFRLFLPVASVESAPAKNVAAPASPVGSKNPLPQLQGSVLIVDDEAHVREITTYALRQCGLEVLEAANGEDGIRLCSAHGELIDVVLLDLTMPGLSGEETLRRLRMKGARQKVILMSGYSENDSTRRCLQLGASAFVQKPFELPHLLDLIAAQLR